MSGLSTKPSKFLATELTVRCGPAAVDAADLPTEILDKISSRQQGLSYSLLARVSLNL
jgi:hypothetical protein